MPANMETILPAWEADVANLKYSMYPDAQVPLIALTGLVDCIDTVPKTAYDSRKAIVASSPICSSLKEILPESLADEFDDDEEFPIDLIRAERDSPLRTRVVEGMILDGLPEGTTMISSREYFLARFLGQASFNFAVDIRPLRLNMHIARHPLQVYFPESLAVIETHQ